MLQARAALSRLLVAAPQTTLPTAKPRLPARACALQASSAAALALWTAVQPAVHQVALTPWLASSVLAMHQQGDRERKSGPSHVQTQLLTPEVHGSAHKQHQSGTKLPQVRCLPAQQIRTHAKRVAAAALVTVCMACSMVAVAL